MESNEKSLQDLLEQHEHSTIIEKCAHLIERHEHSTGFKKVLENLLRNAFE